MVELIEMDNLKILNRVKEIYSQNHNIIKFLKDTNGNINNTIEDILISYDFQAGSYIDHYKKNPEFNAQYCSGIANVINQLGCFDSVLEVGIGEATTLGNLIKYLKHTPNRKYGFDISWSRIKYAKKFLQSLNISDIGLFTGDMFNTPIKDNAIDIVYTSHSIEPNGGREKEALSELYRITKKYLILLEPTYEFGGKEAKKRMLEHGYVTNLYGLI
jgi:ubiquinone/menaquinone biosynthesis C-methylase UbiE